MARKLIHVAAAVIRDEKQNVLIAKRASDKHQGGLWEFPGGKVEEGETVVSALTRELEEELGITVLSSRPLILVPYHYEDKSVLLDVHVVNEFAGEPWGKEGQPVKWVSETEMETYAFPAANKPILNACLLPSSLFITPELPMASVAEKVEIACKRGVQGVVLRAHHLSDDEFENLSTLLSGVCEKHKVMLIMNRHIELGNRLAADALHLSSHQLKLLGAREDFKGRWLSASCHNKEELSLAVEKGLDFVFLSPVLHTRSHPDTEGLGWQGFRDLVKDCPIPVYALGGLSSKDISLSKSNGAQGVAAISAWLEE